MLEPIAHSPRFRDAGMVPRQVCALRVLATPALCTLVAQPLCVPLLVVQYDPALSGPQHVLEVRGDVLRHLYDHFNHPKVWCRPERSQKGGGGGSVRRVRRRRR